MTRVPDPLALERLAARRSIRRFTPRALDEGLLESCLAAAQRAASSHLLQAYLVLRVREAATRARLAELCGGQAQVREAPVFLVLCAEQRRVRLACAARGVLPHWSLESFLLAVLDTCIFAQALAVAAESQGLGIGYVGGLRNRLFEVDALLELPADVFPLFGLCLGWPDEQPVSWPRLPLAEVLHEERVLPLERTREHLQAYDAAVRAVHAGRGKPHYDWSSQVARLCAAVQRPDLARYYTSKGARLE